MTTAGFGTGPFGTMPFGGGADVSAVPLPPIGPMDGPRWSWAFGAWNALPTGEMPNAKQRSLKLALRGSSTASFSLDGYADEAGDITELVTDVWAVRNGQCLFRGRVGPSSDDVDSASHTVQFTAGDYRGVLARRQLFDADPLTYTAADRADIAWGLVSTTQAQSGGNLGIVRGVGQQLGVAQTITYPAGQIIGPALGQLQAMDAGFDYDITPSLSSTAMTFDIWPYRGINASRVLSYPGPIAAFTRHVDPGDYANAIRETGDTGLAAVRVEASDIATRPEGRWDAQLGDTTLLDAPSVASRASFDLALRSEVVPAWTVKLRPNFWGGPTDVWVGDTVLLHITSGRLAVEGIQYRVQEIQIDLDDSDNETVTLTLGSLLAGQRAGDRSVSYRLTQLERR